MKNKERLIVTFTKLDTDGVESVERKGKGFILTEGYKIVETPDGYMPTTVLWVCDLENGEVNAFYPEDVIIGLNDNDLM